MSVCCGIFSLDLFYVGILVFVSGFVQVARVSGNVVGVVLESVSVKFV